MNRRGLSRNGRIFFWSVLILLGVLALIAAAAGLWVYTIASVILASLFVYSAPFVLGRGWRPKPPASTRTPVVRRRR